jgi:nitrogen fixation NifU-like protein
MNIHESHKNTGEEEAKNTCSPQIIRAAFHPRHRFELLSATALSSLTGDCGDETNIYLKIEDNIITDASFTTSGCFGQVAAAEMAVNMAIGKSVAEAFAISAEEIDEELGHLPPELYHCCEDSATLLSLALRDYLSQKSAPWKRIYG